MTTLSKKTFKQIEIKIMAYSEIIFNLVWDIKPMYYLELLYLAGKLPLGPS
jgi:hypothetical protein